MNQTTFLKATGSISLSHAMPRCGLAFGTPVVTLRGTVPIETIAPGDTLVTRNGARTVMDIKVAVVKQAQIVRIGESVLGPEQPAVELIVSPLQPVLVRGWRAQNMTGKDIGMIAAQDLVDGAFVRVETKDQLRIISLRFAEDQVIYAGGIEVACAALAARG